MGGIPPAPFDKYFVRVDGLVKLLSKIPTIKGYINTFDVPGAIKANPELSMDRVKVIEDGYELGLPFNLPAKSWRLNGSRQNLQASESVESSQESLATIRTPNTKTTQLKFIHTPGHTPGSQCILLNDIRLFTGGKYQTHY